MILSKFGDEYKLITAPGPKELTDAKEIDAIFQY